ncbi:MAG: hypothetical protein M3R47_12935 [Chloroflexota bacterium]|nr:hypothetical protein [Chloroflexota bacterium]
MMTIRRACAILYAIVSGVIIAFQLALAAGAPWGEYAMGGAFPGQFPPALRIAALVQVALLVGLAVIVLARAGLVALWSRAARWLIWVVVGFSALSLVLNLITPSAGERAIWAPIAFLLLISSAVVAFTNPSAPPAQ